MTPGGKVGGHMSTTFSACGMKTLQSMMASVLGRVRLRHVFCSILSVSLAACITTPGELVDSRSKVYSPGIGNDRSHKSVAVFLNWNGSCALGKCDAPPLTLHDRAASCIQSGLQRVNPDLRAIAGPVELRQDTSALVADPREHGQPDSRFDTDLVSKLREKEIRYAVVLDISRVWAPGPQRKHVDVTAHGAEYILLIAVARSARTPLHARAEAILIDLDSRRWLARIHSDFKDTEIDGAVVILPVPIPIILDNSSSAALSACEKVGEELGYLLAGKQGSP